MKTTITNPDSDGAKYSDLGARTPKDIVRRLRKLTNPVLAYTEPVGRWWLDSLSAETRARLEARNGS